ncbi:hypothetical protein LSH36_386g02007 [Paralvinella palmiformis]|uniref:DNA excision repair protein ERCC-1 n=1 Tax=Paralvinella palmiformis TaxID=53620 RepID=A0AAD9JCX9_9ANNE|nr:hypothetical protein LSH36_386g02007 [Paralvinella palmiformis]
MEVADKESHKEGEVRHKNAGTTSTLIRPASDVVNEKGSIKGGTGQKKHTNSMLVSSRQKGNPVLKFIRSVPWEYDDIVPDYEMAPTRCALFLSLRYHQLNPNYIHERLKQLGHSYELRVLLTLIDIKDPHHCLKELAKISILADCTLILAFSANEAGRYLETYKAYENKPPDLIMERADGDYMTRVTECLTRVRRVNKTDAMTLLHTFGSLEKIVQASEEDLSLCPGFGPQKYYED